MGKRQRRKRNATTPAKSQRDQEKATESVGTTELPRVAATTSDWRVSLLVLGICCAIYVPLLGEYGMYDPWETIYTETGRQFLERDDWLSPYWHNGTGPEGWAETNFWSKPVGSFWLSALSLKIFGWEDEITLRETGRTLADPATGPPAGIGRDPGEVITNDNVEWAVRAPFVLCGLFAIWCIFLFCSRIFGTRAGVFAALILATSPMFFFIARQAMTDMPYVGLMSGGIALFALAIFGPKQQIQRKSIHIAGRHICIPHDPAFYLFVATFIATMTLIFFAITPPLLPLPVFRDIPISRAISLSIYGVGALVFLWLARKTSTKNEIYLYTFYMVTAMSGLAKGLIGALQPGFVVLLYLFTTREWKILADAALGRGLLIAGVVFAPWWHAMVLRHGLRFWNELMGVEQLKRLTIGEQQQAKGTWDYYVRQVGYGLFPWVALLPAALARAFSIGDATKRSARDRARLFCYIWFSAAMVLFTLTATKYHHYILPAIPPAAIIVALYLDDLLAGRVKNAWIGLVGTTVALAVVTVDLVSQPANWVWMFTYLYTGNWAKGAPHDLPTLSYAIVFGVALLVALIPRWRKFALVSTLAIAVGCGGYILNAYQVRCSEHWGQKYVLQTYYKLRKGPQEQLIAWQFNWRGETWHTAAQVVIAKSLKNAAIQKWLRERKGRRFFFITEKSRYASLRNMLPTPEGKKTLTIVDDSNVHFVLARADI